MEERGRPSRARRKPGKAPRRPGPELARRRRRMALALVAALGIAASGALVRVLEGEDGTLEVANELPDGGQTIFPGHRVIGYYGAPQSDELGALGIGSPDRAAEQLKRQAAEYDRGGGRKVLRAFELLATIASEGPGEDGAYRQRQGPDVIDRYLEAARRHKALLVLDIQPGRGDFITEAGALEEWLRQPDVGLALDPEWHVGPDEFPGRDLGTVDASVVNEVAEYLSRLVDTYNLPQKLLLVHQFTEEMISNRDALREPEGVAMAINIDGFGDRIAKEGKYYSLNSGNTLHRGFKLFYKEDTGLMTPSQVLDLQPKPEVIIYE
jgi:hypothetical protein